MNGIRTFDQLEKVDLHIPSKCSKCGNHMKYKGVGEYECEECGNLEYDDYGKVRNYLEVHVGATASDVEAATGVKREAISRLLSENRIDVKPFSRNELGKLI